MDPDTDACPTCGRPLDAHDRHVRFRLPEPVLRTEERERAAGTWMSDDDPTDAVMMQVPGLGGFVRCLLPVRLTGGSTVTFGVWLGVHPDDLRRTAEVWWEPAYAELELEGRLANHLPGWDVLGAPARASVDDEDAVPTITGSSDPGLHRVLTGEWAHDEVLDRLP